LLARLRAFAASAFSSGLRCGSVAGVSHRFLFSGWLALALSCCGLATSSSVAAEPPRPRQYAPERSVDFEHLTLDITPNFRQRTIAGEANLRFVVLARPVSTLRLDAVDLRVTNVTASVAVADWEVTQDALLIHFERPLAASSEGWVRVLYTAQPSQGLYFRTPEMGFPPEDEHLWTQGQSTTSRNWFPAFDWPNDKLTSEVTCRVPEGMVVLSNGRQVNEVRTNGLVAVTWLQDKPHANYLVVLVAGNLRKLEGRHRDIPLGFWTLPSDSTNAARGFAGTADMMAFFEKYTGTPYPWPKYDQVCVEDFVAGGMENTTLTVLQDDALFGPGFENLRTMQGLVAHELAHQWFGDLVTCKDWVNTWLNEGFATYFEDLYREHKDGRDDFLYHLHESRRGLTDNAGDTRPMVWRGYADPDDMFDHRAYGRGAWVLHMLRCELGDELFRQTIRTYLELHAYGSVVTEDLVAVAEGVSGRSLDQFFDQWVFHGGRPELDVNYSWDDATKIARVTVRQLQPVSDQVLLFNVPLSLRFKLKDAVIERQADVTQVNEDFFFPLPQRPELVRVDPQVALMAKINFHPPAAMLAMQVADPKDAIGRVQAVQQLAGRRDHEAIELLKTRLNEDPFYGVRVEAAKGLRAIHSEEALTVLLASTKQKDARVRHEVVQAIGGFNQDSARDALLATAREEKNPDIAAAAVGALDAWRTPEVREQLLRLLRSQSYDQVLASAAVQALRKQDDPATLAPVFAAVREREREWPKHAVGTGFDAVAWLARGEEDKTAVREYLIGQTASLRRSTRLAAINALGQLEDTRALPVLENFTQAARDNPERQAAERAIGAIRGARKPPAELGTLRDEVRDLRKENRELKSSVEQLQKQFEALKPAAEKAPAKPKKN
jgi:aminopeptidase N